VKLQKKTSTLPRRARARLGGTLRREAQGSSTARELPVISLSGFIPVPVCQLGASHLVALVPEASRVQAPTLPDLTEPNGLSARYQIAGPSRAQMKAADAG